MKSKMKFREIKQMSHNLRKTPFKCPMKDFLKTSSKGFHCKVDLRHLWHVKLEHGQYIRSRHPRNFKFGFRWDGQIESLGDVLGTLEGDVHRTSTGPIFAGWVCMCVCVCVCMCTGYSVLTRRLGWLMFFCCTPLLFQSEW